jgi:hypothetical protein
VIVLLVLLFDEPHREHKMPQPYCLRFGPWTVALVVVAATASSDDGSCEADSCNKAGRFLS